MFLSCLYNVSNFAINLFNSNAFNSLNRYRELWNKKSWNIVPNIATQMSSKGFEYRVYSNHEYNDTDIQIII